MTYLKKIIFENMKIPTLKPVSTVVETLPVSTALDIMQANSLHYLSLYPNQSEVQKNSQVWLEPPLT